MRVTMKDLKNKEKDFVGGAVLTNDDIECFNLWLKNGEKNG